MCKSCRWCLHNKFRYGFSYQIAPEKLSPGSQHLLSLLKQQLFFQVWQTQFWPCSHPFAIPLKRFFSYPVTLTTSAILSALFWLLLLRWFKQEASSFSELFLACSCLVISQSALSNRLSLLFHQWLPPSASTRSNNTEAASSSATVSFVPGSNSLGPSPELLIAVPPLPPQRLPCCYT